ncbi:MAG TPA: flagellar hook capping FlgD N-terminal domain-containing protein [Cellulomonas sp.]
MSTDMSIPISYLTADRTSSSTTPTDKTQIDNQGFLQLLIAQLANQDPSSPTDSSTILTQTTQLAQMQTLEEQISTARESFALQMRETAATFVGREVTWQDSDGAAHSGVVASVDYTGSVPQLRVGDADVALDAIQTLAPAD